MTFHFPKLKIVAKIVGIKLGFCRIRYTLQLITRHLIYFTTGHDSQIHIGQDTCKVTDNFLI